MVEKKSFLQWLEEGMKTITPDQFAESTNEIPKGAKVVGEMNEDLKRMFSFFSLQAALAEKLLEQAAEAFQEKSKKARQENKPFGMKEIEETFWKEFPASEIAAMKIRLKTLKEVFFASLKAEFDLWEEETVGVSRGFKVYVAEEEECGCLLCKGGGSVIVASIIRAEEGLKKEEKGPTVH